MRIAWATDLHLDSVSEGDVVNLCSAIKASGASAAMLSGDIAESTSVVHWLDFIDSTLEMPLYFVLGNHDFYGSSVQTVREEMRDLPSKRVFYLPATGPIQLTAEVALVGHDGWGDCRIGDVEHFEILSDYFAIADLRNSVSMDALMSGKFERGPLREKLRVLGDDAAATLRPNLADAARIARSVVVLTHVPPFREACWHDGSVSEETWLPGFTCKAVGDLLVSVAEQFKSTSFLVLCGHTHGSGHVQLRPNLRVETGFGHYGTLVFGTVDIDGANIDADRPRPTGERASRRGET